MPSRSELPGEIKRKKFLKALERLGFGIDFIYFVIMNSELQNIIKQSTFEIQEGRYIYAKVKSFGSFKSHFMVSYDKDEITVITKEENLDSLDLLERNKDNYILIALNVSIPFYSVGFLATVSSTIAEAGMNILIVSTYSKDYILVREDCKGKAREILLELGFQEKNKN